MQNREQSMLKQFMPCGKTEDTFLRKTSNLGLNVNLDYFLLKKQKGNSKTRGKTREIINI